MTVSYLAIVCDRNRVTGKGKVKCIAKKLSNGEWDILKEILYFPTSHEHQRYSEKELVLIELDAQQRIIASCEGLPELLLYLQSLKNQLTKYEQGVSEIELWRSSLEYQAAVQFEREESLKSREAVIKQKEKKIQQLLDTAINLAQKN